MTILKNLTLAAIVALLMGATFETGYYSAPEVTRFGVIQQLVFARNEIVIEGNLYPVSMTADVQIGGGYGAYTMLQSGMRVEYRYLRHEDGMREVIMVRELASSETLDLF